MFDFIDNLRGEWAGWVAFILLLTAQLGFQLLKGQLQYIVVLTSLIAWVICLFLYKHHNPNDDDW